jgi:uncharacterized cupin superfamily protein
MKEGKVVFTNTGRYAVPLENGSLHELTSGDVVQVLVDGKWETTRVESSMKKYYLVNGCPIEGAEVRIK